MAAFPAMPFYTDAYLADTRHLTTEEHGAYLLLLMCAWRNANCALADDDKSLARITGLTPARWRRMRPRLTPFFDMEGGFWRQQKLTSIHADVAARVARNRVSGARGGRALAAKRKQTARQSSSARISGVTGKSASEITSKPGSKNPAAKTKTKQRQLPAPVAPVAELDAPTTLSDGWGPAIASVCGPDTHLDTSVIQIWQAAEVDLALDVLPTIEAVFQREITRTGKPPLRLGYYRDAVLEASTRRAHVGGGYAASGSCKGARTGAQDTKQVFNPDSTDHWRQVLGDAESQFRGDYMAQNWFIPADHPVFQERTLGPNPRFGPNLLIPREIHQQYAQPWHWQGQLRSQLKDQPKGHSTDQSQQAAHAPVA